MRYPSCKIYCRTGGGGVQRVLQKSRGVKELTHMVKGHDDHRPARAKISMERTRAFVTAIANDIQLL